MNIARALLLALAATLHPVEVAMAYPFENPDLPLEERLSDLVSRMTLEEKVGQMQNSAPAIERLSIPEYDWWNECLHGVARAGTATVFPQAIGLAASFNTALMRRVADAISDEARAKHHDAARRGVRRIYTGLTFWSPNINIFRDPRWGRGQETYGEDPFLTARMGVAFVSGLQGDDPRHLKLVATPKHYAVHSGLEAERHHFNAVVSDYDLWMTYLPAFEATLREARAQSVMGAYNRVNGHPACAHPRLLGEILRERWGFDGYVVSDCGAIDNIWRDHRVVPTAEEAAALAVKNGCDLECGRSYGALIGAVSRGLISEKEIDLAVTRLMRARFLLGMFDPPDRVRYARIPASVVGSPAHRELAREAARQSIVLLKNERNLLPQTGREKFAVVGPNADDVNVLLGNYHGTPVDPVTPLAGLRARLGEKNVLYARGCDLVRVSSLGTIPSGCLRAPDGRPGLRGEYFSNRELSGDPALVRQDATIAFNWGGAPAPGLPADDFSVRWSGALVPEMSGRYTLAVTADDGARLFLDGEKLIDDWTQHAPTTHEVTVALEAGRRYELRIEYYEAKVGAVMRLLWAVPGEKRLAEAVAAARQADVVVAVLSLSCQLEDEGRDRATIELPEVQERLLKELHATGKPIVLVLLTGSAVAVPWAKEHIPAIVCAWYPGEEAGHALAEVLLGDVNPAGRLPVTFYASTGELPDFRDYSMKGRTYRYLTREPLWRFGYGLSYTTFRYDALTVPGELRAGEPMRVSVRVTNAGRRAGDEVAQVYLGGGAPAPLRRLVGFRRLYLRPGESDTLTFTITPRQMAVIDRDENWIVSPGTLEVFAGGCSPAVEGRDAGMPTARVTLVGRAAAVD
ncbi:glycoside hydrolase family 3 C-terminal domain-containing protein [bacterium]|nr:glycoside hydrolase family 3 C-terminal domain-containing protein [bacterium]